MAVYGQAGLNIIVFDKKEFLCHLAQQFRRRLAGIYQLKTALRGNRIGTTFMMCGVRSIKKVKQAAIQLMGKCRRLRRCEPICKVWKNYQAEFNVVKNVFLTKK
jgi:hypothetical protein